MAPRCLPAVTAVLLCCILGMLSPPPAVNGRRTRACCTKYTRQPVAFKFIKGFKEQSSLQNCRIDAIIFYTVRNKELCANPKDDWVREALAHLSLKLKKMSKSKTGLAAGGAKPETTGISYSSGSGTISDLSRDNVTFSNTTGAGILSSSVMADLMYNNS